MKYPRYYLERACLATIPPTALFGRCRRYSMGASVRPGDGEFLNGEPVLVSIHSQAGFLDNPNRGRGRGLGLFPYARYSRRRLFVPMGGLWHPL